MVEAIEKLHGGFGKPCFGHCLGRFFRQQAGCAGVGSIRLGDHDVAGGNCRGKIAARDAVESEGKVIWAKHGQRSERRQLRADLQFRIDRGHGPGSISCGSGRLA